MQVGKFVQRTGRRGQSALRWSSGSDGGECGVERRMSVAVVGAGAAGLVAARELRKQNLDVRVFERGSQVGGTWVYDSTSPQGTGKADLYHIHSSVYDTLRVNLPKEIMGYSDYPFVKYKDDRRYCLHEEVLLYLQSFARHFNIERLIEKNTLVERASPIVQSSSAASSGERFKWRLKLREKGSQACKEEVFDALVVCNGHFEVPRVPKGSNFETDFAGVQVHSRDYKRAKDEAYMGKSVLVVGTGPSGDDISREVSQVAKKVYWSGRLFSRVGKEKLTQMRQSLKENVYLKSNAVRVGGSGDLVYFEDERDEPVKIDTILWCTGYEYSVPFLETGLESGKDGNVDKLEISTSKGRIEPLYEHLFHPRFAQSLSFIGLGFKILPFPFFEIQSQWVARCIAGSASLPSQEEMLKSVREFYQGIEKKDPGPRGQSMTHCMDGIQWAYLDKITSKPGMEECEPLADWKIKLYEINRKKKGLHPTNYRDVTLDEEIPFMEKGLEEMNLQPPRYNS